MNIRQSTPDNQCLDLSIGDSARKLGWHFVANRHGEPVHYSGDKVQLGRRSCGDYHGSWDALGALQWAPGALICRIMAPPEAAEVRPWQIECRAEAAQGAAPNKTLLVC
jgi:hypothetical protein